MSNNLERKEFVVPKTTSKIKQVAIYSGVIFGLMIIMTGTVSAFTGDLDKATEFFNIQFELLQDYELEQKDLILTHEREDEAMAEKVKAQKSVLGEAEQGLAVEKLKELGNIKMGDMTGEQRGEYSRLELKVQPLEVGVAFEPVTSFPQV